MSFDDILEKVKQYYNKKIQMYGATPKGVDWNSLKSQQLRFEKLLKICSRNETFSINDYGCGYGALFKYMTDQDYSFRYRGFDMSEHMIANGKELFKSFNHCKFFTDESRLTEVDYSVASGIFNVKLQTSNNEWLRYILYTLKKISDLSKKGFAFNLLSNYSNRHLMRENLFYANPSFFFNYCKINFSKYVSLLHDYPLYEFTILVKK